MKRTLLEAGAAALLIASLSGLITGLIVKGGIDAGARRGQQRIYHAEVNACGRQNQRQQALNTNAYATWREDTLFAQDLAPQPAQRRTPAEQRAITEFRARLLSVTSSLTWTPLNYDCATDPTAVELPVSFSQALPPKSALSNP